MKIITFYSFRGGVGRSMTVANIAHVMAERKERRVLLIDFDLEAPGISLMPYFQTKEDGEATKGGIVEFILAWQNDEAPKLADYISNSAKHGRNIAICRAGSHRLPELKHDELFSIHNGSTFAEYIRSESEQLGYHYVLIDSRTGLTEISGLCTLAMPDLVIVLTGLNLQNSEGTKWVLSQLRSYPSGVKDFVLVYSHVPDSEEELKRVVMNRAREAFDLPNDLQPLQLTYHPRMSLNEELFVEEWPDSMLAKRYRQLFDEIIQKNSEDLTALIRRLNDEKITLVPPRGLDELLNIEEVALRLYPENHKLRYALGSAYMKRASELIRSPEARKDINAEEIKAAFAKAVKSFRVSLPGLGGEILLEAHVNIVNALLNSGNSDSARLETTRTVQFILNLPVTQQLPRATSLLLLIYQLNLDEVNRLFAEAFPSLNLSLIGAVREVSPPWQYYTQLLVLLRWYDKAVQALSRSLEFDPSNLTILRQLAFHSSRSGQLEDAKDYYAKALELDPSDMSTLSNDAELATIQHDRARFELRYEQAKKQFTKDGYEATIFHFLEWVQSPTDNFHPVITAFKSRSSNQPIGWDFSDILPYIKTLPAEFQATAEKLINVLRGILPLSILEPTISKRRTRRRNL